MASTYDPNQQATYAARFAQPVQQLAAQPALSVVESASATTAQQQTGPGAYVVFGVAAVLLCLALRALGGVAGNLLGDFVEDVIEEYGYEAFDLEEYRELQDYLSDDDPVSPGGWDFLDGGGTPTSTRVPTHRIARSIA